MRRFNLFFLIFILFSSVFLTQCLDPGSGGLGGTGLGGSLNSETSVDVNSTESIGINEIPGGDDLAPIIEPDFGDDAGIYNLPVTIAKLDSEYRIDALGIGVDLQVDTDLPAAELDSLGAWLMHFWPVNEVQAAINEFRFFVYGVRDTVTSGSDIIVDNGQEHVETTASEDGSFRVELPLSMMEKMGVIRHKNVPESFRGSEVRLGMYVTRKGSFAIGITDDEKDVIAMGSTYVYNNFVFYDVLKPNGDILYKVRPLNGGKSLKIGKGKSILKQKMFFPMVANSQKNIPHRLIGITEELDLAVVTPNTYYIANDISNGSKLKNGQPLDVEEISMAASSSGRFAILSPRLPGWTSSYVMVPLAREGKDLIIKNSMLDYVTMSWLDWKDGAHLVALVETVTNKDSVRELFSDDYNGHSFTNANANNANNGNTAMAESNPFLSDDRLDDETEEEGSDSLLESETDENLEESEDDYAEDDEVDAQQPIVQAQSLVELSSGGERVSLRERSERIIDRRLYSVVRYDLSNILKYSVQDLNTFMNDAGNNQLNIIPERIITFKMKSCREIETAPQESKVPYFLTMCRHANQNWRLVLYSAQGAFILTPSKESVMNVKINKNGTLIAYTAEYPDEKKVGTRVLHLPSGQTDWIVTPKPESQIKLRNPTWSRIYNYALSFESSARIDEDRGVQRNTQVNVSNLLFNKKFNAVIQKYDQEGEFTLDHYYADDHFTKVPDLGDDSVKGISTPLQVKTIEGSPQLGTKKMKSLPTQ